jgi:hypothetical protein
MVLYALFVLLVPCHQQPMHLLTRKVAAPIRAGSQSLFSALFFGNVQRNPGARCGPHALAWAKRVHLEKWGIEPQAYRMRSDRSTPELLPRGLDAPLGNKDIINSPGDIFKDFTGPFHH